MVFIRGTVDKSRKCEKCVRNKQAYVLSVAKEIEREFDVQPGALKARPDLPTCVVLGRALRFDYKKDYISKHSKSKSNQKSKLHSNSNPTSKPRLTSKWKSTSWLEKVPRNSLRVTLTQAIFEHRRIQDELVGQEMTNIRENVVVRDTDQEKMASSSRRRTF